MSQKGIGTSSPSEKPTFDECGNKHYGASLIGTDKWISCGKIVHKVWDLSNVKGQDNGAQTQESGSSDAPKKNRFYALHSRGEQDTSSDVLTGMLKDFSFDKYNLLHPGSTLLFVTPLVAKKFDILPGI